MIGLVIFLLAVYFFLYNEKRYISIFCIFMLATSGFQLIPVDLITLPAAGVSKPYDWVLIFTGLMFLFFPKLFLNQAIWKTYKNLKVFGAVLVFLLLYSIYIRGVEVSISIRVFRNFIFFLPIFLFTTIDKKAFEKIFGLIIYATTIASIFYCLQTITGKAILNTVGSDTVTVNDETPVTRFYNLPVFIYPVIFFFFFGKKVVNIKFYYVLMAINAIAIILSQHRNLLLAIICCYLLHLFLSQKIKPVKLVAYVVGAIIVFNIGDSLLGNRFSEGAKDLSHASVGVSPATINALNLSDLSTTEFRYYLVVERLQYVMLNPVTSMFGIGFLTEDSRKTQDLRFNIGLPDDENNVTQVDTGDVIWSVMVLQFGLFGILFFIFFYYYFLRIFYVFKKSVVPQIGILYIVILFITSFYGTAILQPYSTCMVVFIAAYTYVLNTSTNFSIYSFKNKSNEGFDHYALV